MPKNSIDLIYCPRCKKNVIGVTKMFDTIVCGVCDIIIHSPTRDKVGR